MNVGVPKGVWPGAGGDEDGIADADNGPRDKCAVVVVVVVWISCIALWPASSAVGANPFEFAFEFGDELFDPPPGALIESNGFVNWTPVCAGSDARCMSSGRVICRGVGYPCC